MAVSKVSYNGTTLIDLTDTTAVAADVANGKYFYAVDGTRTQGTASGSTLQTKSVTYTPTASQQTEAVTPSSGYDGLSQVNVTVNAMPTGQYRMVEVAVSNSISVDSSGLISASATASGTDTPVYDSGYIPDSAVFNYWGYGNATHQLTTKAAATITPTTSNQTIASGTYLTGAQTISGDADLVAGNIKSGVTIFNVTGTYSGGVSGVAKGTLTVPSNVNTSTSTQITTTTAIGFTPKCFLFYRSDRSATNYHVNQASFITLGSSYYVRTMTRYSSNALSTSGNTNSWTTQTAGYLYFSSNTIYFRSSSSYILPSGTWYWVAIE